MKKIILLIVLAFLGFNSSYGQGSFRLGVNAGLPIGEAADFTSFQLGADVAYMLSLADVVAVGPMVGYSHFIGDTGERNGLSMEAESVQFIPVAVSGRFNLLALALGLDLGYALGLGEGNSSGLYYRPQVGFSIGPVGLIASYQGVNVDNETISSVNLGVEFGL